MGYKRLSEVTAASADFSSAEFLIGGSTVGNSSDYRYSQEQIFNGANIYLSTSAVTIGSNSSTVFTVALSLSPTIISLLPASSAAPGMRATILDSTVSSTGYGILVQGGGNSVAPVFSDGSTAWRVG